VDWLYAGAGVALFDLAVIWFYRRYGWHEPPRHGSERTT